MRKKLRHGMSVVCILLTLVVAILWIRSYFISEALLYRSAINGPELHAFITDGRLIIGAVYDDPISVPAGWVFQRMDTPPDNLFVRWEYERISSVSSGGGFYLAGLAAGFWFNGFCIIVPMWMLVLLLMCFPLVDLICWIRTRRNQAGHCPQCHYDLRASTATCPECGTPIHPQAGKAS